MSGVPGMPLPGWAPELKPCGTPAAYRRHLRRGEIIDDACRKANTRAWADRAAAGKVRRGPRGRVHAPRLQRDVLGRPAGWAACGRAGVAVTDDPGQVTCLNCRYGYRRIPWLPEGVFYRAA